MKILALASYKNGTMNLPKEVRDLLNLGTEGKILFILEDNRVYITKA